MMNLVGSTVCTMLDLDTFLKKNGASWVLADGREAPLGSEYRKLVDVNVPDLRGIFLRGRNYERNREEGNADGDCKPGTYQKSAIEKHTHSYVQMVYNNSIDGVDSTVRNSYEHHNEERQTGATGGSETRPNCVTVNIFICIGAIEEGEG